MYHLKLIKALSYTGAVSATRKEPDVYTEDKAVADAAVASGYFKLVEEVAGSNDGDGTTPPTGNEELDYDKLMRLKKDDLIAKAEEMGIDTADLETKDDLAKAICAAGSDDGNGGADFSQE